MDTDYNAIARAGVDALRRGDAAAARTAFDAVEAAGRGTHQLRLLLAQATTLLRDAPAAHRALDAVLHEEPTNLYALVMKGDLLDHAGDRRAASAWYEGALAQAPRAGALPPDLIASLRRVEGKLIEMRDGFQATLGRTLADGGVDPAAVSPRFAEALAILSGAQGPQLQQPTSFYYPRLPAIPFFDPADFPWIETLVAAAPAILGELQTVMADGAGLAPYVAGEADRPVKAHPLLGDPRWSAWHLWQGGKPLAEAQARCPATLAALAAAPMPVIDGRSPMALFSVLSPGTHIPPHHGMLNTRLICHLPLIVPDGCRLRVGNETRAVRRFEPLLFDDSIEHEAWNDGDATRVVLLFEVWRPELDAGERVALATLYKAVRMETAEG